MTRYVQLDWTALFSLCLTIEQGVLYSFRTANFIERKEMGVKGLHSYVRSQKLWRLISIDDEIRAFKSYVF